MNREESQENKTYSVLFTKFNIVFFLLYCQKKEGIERLSELWKTNKLETIFFFLLLLLSSLLILLLILFIVSGFISFYYYLLLLLLVSHHHHHFKILRY